MLISCTQAAEICDKAQYREASNWQVIKLKFHHVYCKNCRVHAGKNGKLTELCSRADLKCMDSKKKEKLKEEINENIPTRH